VLKRKIPSDKANSIYYARDNAQYVIESTPELGILKSLGIVKDAKVQKVFTHKLGRTRASQGWGERNCHRQGYSRKNNGGGQIMWLDVMKLKKI